MGPTNTRPSISQARSGGAGANHRRISVQSLASGGAISVERIERSILLLRRHKVLLDVDLAKLYDVETKVLLQAVRRNPDRFPNDFMFQLTDQEVRILRSQFVTSSWGGRRYAPYVFTEQGVAMLSSVLNSRRAIAVNMEIMRAFVRLREMIASNKELAKRLDEFEVRIERKLSTHDQAIARILDAIRALMAPPEPTRKRRIGFVQND